MLSTDQMKDDSLIQSEITPKTSHQQFPSHLIVDIKSLSSTRQTTPPQMSSSYLEHLSRNFPQTVDSSSPATTRTKSLNPSTPGVQSLNLESQQNKNQQSLLNSSKDLTGSWTPSGFKVIRESSQNSLTNTSPTGEES